ncbi:hypothetical protein GMA11_06470 [Granulicatella sp. zg-ZJ]|uniref:hypothetical protein n=1 Tax=unclassified Granulicatella TaxID=2630493 RepID=UPI0013C0FE98|nr:MULTISPECIES: hypothetical protein [unclassified Granulicatella]MBS4749851.1 hypothetical protein [Carnobacteriaceae bacterium zg-ZUI78]NEW63037.1 hypothetical protein [Granulicatella sp. zg-ZJ]NEW66210.1 hypothetical protein [Granulicatella sp. zg-84]QMI85947.1 hypothetical protein H1220_00820 [Carnobacteriaceae bacterium zg-84]
MYLSPQETADYLDLSLQDITRLIREKQIRYLVVDDDIFINANQFTLFLKERDKYIKELQDYLNTPLPEDIDVKDED